MLLFLFTALALATQNTVLIDCSGDIKSVTSQERVLYPQCADTMIQIQTAASFHNVQCNCLSSYMNVNNMVTDPDCVDKGVVTFISKKNNLDNLVMYKTEKIGMEVEDGTFTKISFVEGKSQDSKVKDSKFSNFEITKSKFKNMKFSDNTFENGNVMVNDFFDGEIDELTIKDTTVDSNLFSNSKIEKVTLDGSQKTNKLTENVFFKCEISGVTFKNGDLSNTVISQSSIENSKLDNVYISNITSKTQKLEKFEMTNSVVEKANIEVEVSNENKFENVKFVDSVVNLQGGDKATSFKNIILIRSTINGMYKENESGDYSVQNGSLTEDKKSNKAGMIVGIIIAVIVVVAVVAIAVVVGVVFFLKKRNSVIPYSQA
ncbi:hypothetical protein EIN_183620 [Entamoeba invadens IP1]|uniref:hypothetical protein n=1 Tax=Entamoeba invadens IP1 TaxID=370355 RepID=UPI0002C3FAA4|nr:hypothetical protein EIN_183620 [Entamoeba invadens IP1]ELP94065.1 hypothetical protein EIN_183620 [Entamoeba invadens IP1]|eukprot:XP_004260836.1 hypothetical protein EIN_183620 [Entamoeba invadens IP1]